MSGGVRSLWTSVGRIPFHPLVGSPHVPAMDADPERYELSHQRRGGAREVLGVLLPERSGGYRFPQVLASPDCISLRFKQFTQTGQITAKSRPRNQYTVPRTNLRHLQRVRE